ncbi:MAG TPA: cysteine desulfurase [Bacteroidales bacterium]|nr:cysteine desulfurase [Bacteroidales bacterium]
MDVNAVRNDFPILQQKIYGKPLIYLDNAATTQKPNAVMQAIVRYYETLNSNVHRGNHLLSIQATDAMERARNRIASFIHAPHPEEIIFTRGTTESINLVAQGFASSLLQPGDEVIISALEHHSNLVPWQQACLRTGAQLKIIPLDESGQIRLGDFRNLLSEKTRIVAIAHVSNVLGTILPVQDIIDLAHRRGIPVLIDGAQAVQHLPIDVSQLGCDFYAFSGHKIYGPTGIGILYGKGSWLEKIPPFQFGGEMIEIVSFEKTTFNEIPFKFEAGTPNVEGIIGLAAALDYLCQIGLESIFKYETELFEYALHKLSRLDDVRIIGQAKDRCSVISFLLDHIHPYDTGTLLDQMGIAVRSGNHCAQPLIDLLNLPGTVRVSLSFYNTREEIDILITALQKVKDIFQ